MNINTAFASGRLTLYLSGELDHHAARGAAAEIEELLDEYMPRDCALDMSGLTFMDSSGIGLIMGRNTMMKVLGGKLYIRDPPPQIARLLHLARIDAHDTTNAVYVR